MRTLEIHELKAIAGGEIEYDCTFDNEDEGGGGGDASPSYADAKSAPPDNPKQTLAPVTDKDGTTTYSAICGTVSVGVVTQQTCLNSDNTISVQTCVSAGAGVSGQICSISVSKQK